MRFWFPGWLALSLGELIPWREPARRRFSSSAKSGKFPAALLLDDFQQM
jgi:hypothetical protein